jgi:hypothetical protein
MIALVFILVLHAMVYTPLAVVSRARTRINYSYR